MITGIVNDALEATVRVVVQNDERAHECIAVIDTG